MIKVDPAVFRCQKCRKEFITHSPEPKPFCPICQKRAVWVYPAEPIIKQCSWCGCAQCDCENEED